MEAVDTRPGSSAWSWVRPEAARCREYGRRSGDQHRDDLRLAVSDPQMSRVKSSKTLGTEGVSIGVTPRGRGRVTRPGLHRARR